MFSLTFANKVLLAIMLGGMINSFFFFFYKRHNGYLRVWQFHSNLVSLLLNISAQVDINSFYI